MYLRRLWLVRGTLFMGVVILALTALAPVAAAADVNLALKKTYKIEALVPDPAFEKMQWNYPDVDNELTDGEYGAPQYDHMAWQIFTRQGGRNIILDLGEERTIHRLVSSWLHQKGVGVYFPRRVTYAVSNDGKNFAELGTVESKVSLTVEGPQIQKYELAGLNVVGRYVKLSLPVDVHVMIDEFEVWGEEAVSPAATRLQGTPPPTKESVGYLKPGAPEAGGAHHIVLLYAGFYKDPAVTTWVKQDYRPYVVYIDENNKAKDWMFDTIMIPCQGSTSSGRSFVAAPPKAKPANMADWLEFADILFKPGFQLDALNQAVADAQVERKDPGHKVKVILDLLYTNPYQKDFGDVNGDGVSENIDASAGVEEQLRNRAAITKWYLDLLTKRWKEAKLDNLELIGFWWHRESVPYMATDTEERAIQMAADVVHQAGYKLFWIPFAHAEGFLDWKRLGFDASMVQPNYMFADVDKVRLKSIADIAAQTGQGIEVEKHWFERDTEEQKWIDYLNAGAKYGYMKNAVVAYYQNTKDLRNAAYSKDAHKRQVYYDNVYEFIKGTYFEQ
ncbi:MAG: DUF4855 domain-containing protein [Chitinophagales bacterium]